MEILDHVEGKDLRICQTSEDVPAGPYMTLSHRWGSASFLKLTVSNQADLRKGFDIADLPQTFQDAIAVVRRLGCQYIWIDSLCIVQDSPEDWQHEAALMSEVYTFSHCNIAATWNSSSDDGCFTKRNAAEVEGLVVNTKWTCLENITFRVVEFGLWENLVISASLNRRAWFVQERLLAPRVLHFGRTQLAWECHESEACETYPTGIPIAQQTDQSMYKRLDPDTEGKRLQSLGDSRSSPNLYTSHVWKKIVTAYTAGQLTMASDKLVAISGIAKIWQTLLQDEYLAGLWKRTLPSDLLWRALAGKQANGLLSTRSPQYRAPSWSWAALDGPIVPGRPNIDRILVTVVEAVTELREPANPLGQLKSGSIRLRGVLLSGNVRPLEASAPWPEKLSIYFSSENARDHWIYPDIEKEVFDQPVFCFIISTKNQYDGTLVQGLALHCVDRAEATYRRVGLFEGVHKPPSRDFPLQYSTWNRCMELSQSAVPSDITLI